MQRTVTVHFGVLLAGLGLLLGGCDPARVFEENRDIPNNAWADSFKPAFAFAITDTAAAYTVKLNVRNSVSYQFYNLFVGLTLTDPAGRVLSRKLHELVLLDKATGEPLGDGLGDLFDHQSVALRHVRFARAGTYQAQVSQYMRLVLLPEILSVGVRVEKEGSK